MDAICPRCGIQLMSSEVEWVCTCGRCGGVFASRTVGPVTQAVATAAQDASFGAAVRAPTAARIACPMCRAQMERSVFRGIEVDRCGRHGVWFDRDELRHLMKHSRPKTIQGLGNAADGAASAAQAASLYGRPVRLQGKSAVDLAEIGLDVAGPAIAAELEAEDAQAKAFVDLVADFFQP